MTQLLFGTSGWSYKEWVGPFYDKTTKMFSHYSRFFTTAEINSTFYRYPSKATIYGLLRTSPQNFIFSAKLPRLITHEKRLDPDQKIENHLLRFLELLNPLKARHKLGCILIQLPPSFVYARDYHKLRGFLELLPDEYEFAAEFRDHSWMREETWKLLRKHKVAYCIVDEPLLAPTVHLTSEFAYFRWHGRGIRPWYDYRYSENELEEWVPRIEETRDKVDKIYGYFNNHYHGYAVENCIEILEMLNATIPSHNRVKERIIRYNVQQRPMMYERKLEDFGIHITQLGPQDLLRKLVDHRRFERGMRIKDEELTIKELSDENIHAIIRHYTIVLDRKEKIVRHDCDDWRKGVGTKRVCKHVVKLLMTIPAETAKHILKEIIENKDDWNFQVG